MKVSVVIPALNEEACIAGTVRALHAALRAQAIAHEILVVNDNSSDGTGEILAALAGEIAGLRTIDNPPPNGFGFAVRKGLENFSGDAVAICMADASDRPQDLVAFIRRMETTGSDCVFGSRFVKGGSTENYPFPKLFLNRIANFFIGLLFGLRYNDVTNAFKLYRRHVIEGVQPFLSHHFNLTVELPLKAIVRGYSFEVVPNTYVNRTAGIPKFKIKEMGSRYLFIVLYCLIEKWLSRGDYHRRNLPSSTPDLELSDQNLDS